MNDWNNFKASFAQKCNDAEPAMSEIKDGGPAFPGPDQAEQTVDINEGMTLRDYFAAKAMQAVVLKQNELHDIQAMYDRLALHAYKVADAMLKARGES
jgi:hypothetical protein